MTSLILHVGPAKCGSSSIQYFFATQKKPCVQSIYYTMLNPLEISDLNHENPSESIIARFTQLLLDNIIGHDVMILSHEYLFQCPYAIKNICSLAESLVTKISIIGYARRQSEFLISEYSQWSFRSPDQIKEDIELLNKFEIDSILFSGLERYLISSIANDFYSSRLSDYRIWEWYNSYKDISELVHKTGAVIKCGVLPNKESENTLIQDFCEKSDLTLYDEMRDAIQQIVNIRFNQDIIESIDNAVAFGLEMPGPHDKNEVLHLLSSKMSQVTNNSSNFLLNLKLYIDSYFLRINHQFCQEYGLSEAYFASSRHLDKQEILEIITHEAQERALNKSNIINNYRLLSARLIELCLKITKSNQTLIR